MAFVQYLEFHQLIDYEDKYSRLHSRSDSHFVLEWSKESRG